MRVKALHGQSGRTVYGQRLVANHCAARAGTAERRSVQRRAAATFRSFDEFEAEPIVHQNGVADFYALLQVDDDASFDEVKAAYRSLTKVCHPDFTGDAGHNLCVMLNEAYQVLSNPDAREAYNQELQTALQDLSDGYTGEPLSKWMPTANPGLAKNSDPAESRAIFVDEQSCIGCKNCMWCAPATFRIEDDFGRSRAYAQWADTEDDIDTAVLSCPVDCIHWVDKAELPALEHVSQRQQERVGVSTMLTQQGTASDVFAATKLFLKERHQLEEERRKQQAASVSPMQEAARSEAADTFSKARGGWFASFGRNVRQHLSNSASGHRGANVAAAAASCGINDRGRVGCRKRAQKWNATAVYSSSDGEGVPDEYAMVHVQTDKPSWRYDTD